MKCGERQKRARELASRKLYKRGNGLLPFHAAKTQHSVPRLTSHLRTHQKDNKPYVLSCALSSIIMLINRGLVIIR